MEIFVNSFFTFYSNKVGPDFSKIKIKSFKDVVEVEVERKKSQILCLLTGVQQCFFHSWPLDSCPWDNLSPTIVKGPDKLLLA